MGNSEADKRFEKALRSLGYAILGIQKASIAVPGAGVRLTEVRFKLDADNRTSVLGVIKGQEDGERLIAFVGGPDLETVVRSVGRGLSGKALRWREDQPYIGG